MRLLYNVGHTAMMRHVLKTTFNGTSWPSFWIGEEHEVSHIRDVLWSRSEATGRTMCAMYLPRKKND